jgi:hypothetical protein
MLAASIVERYHSTFLAPAERTQTQDWAAALAAQSWAKADSPSVALYIVTSLLEWWCLMKVLAGFVAGLFCGALVVWWYAPALNMRVFYTAPPVAISAYMRGEPSRIGVLPSGVVLYGLRPRQSKDEHWWGYLPVNLGTQGEAEAVLGTDEGKATFSVFPITGVHGKSVTDEQYEQFSTEVEDIYPGPVLHENRTPAQSDAGYSPRSIDGSQWESRADQVWPPASTTPSADSTRWSGPK